MSVLSNLYYGSNDDIMSFFIQAISIKTNYKIFEEREFIENITSLTEGDLFSQSPQGFIITNTTDNFLNTYNKIKNEKTLYLFSKSIRSNSKLLKEFEKKQVIKCYDFTPQQKQTILSKYIKSDFEHNAVTFIAEHINPSQWVNSIKKLNILNKKITLNDVEKHCYKTAEHDISSFLFMLSDGNYNALKIDLKLEPVVLIRLIMSHFNKLLLAKEEPHIKQLVFFKYQLQFNNSLKNLNPEQISRVIYILTTAEIAVKSKNIFLKKVIFDILNIVNKNYKE